MGTVGPENADYFEGDSSDRIFSLKSGKPPAAVRQPLPEESLLVAAIPVGIFALLVFGAALLVLVRSWL